MKDSGIEWIGEIPKDWEVTKLKYVTQNHYSGGTPTASNSDFYNDDGYYFVNISDISNQRYLNTTTKRITERGIKDKNLKVVPRDSILYAMYASVGKLSISKVETYISQAIISFIETEAINKNYLINSLINMEQFIKYLSNGTTQMNLNAEIVKNYKLVLPSLQKQQTIANFLDQKVSEIDHILEKTKESIEEYKKYKQSIITEAVTKGVNPNVEMKDSGIEWIGEIPEHWEVKRMKHISQLNPSCKTTELYDDSIVTFTPMECVYNGYFENKEGLFGNLNSSYTPFQNQDIIIAKVTPCFENGNIAIADNLFNGFGYGSSELFVIRCTDVFNKFIFYYLQNGNFIEEASSTMTGVAGLKRVSSYFMKNAPVTIPSIEEQYKIVEYLDSKILEIDSLISQKETLLKDLEVYKKSLIYECVTGKREVM